MGKSKAKLHSLLIGINKFLYAKNLAGCVNDVTQMKSYLGTIKSERLEVQEPFILLDEKATRENIIKAFEEHLIQKVEEGDVAFFQFAGHGTQEIAHDVFKEFEPDGKLEGLLCHDSGTAGTRILADKELRYLIHKLSTKGCEIICVFDCCHSGDFRASSTEEARYADSGCSDIESQPRAWEEFVFHKEPGLKDPTKLKGKSLEEILPQGKHVQLAACLDSERAYESSLRKQGHFTYALLKILKKSKSPVSYFELQRRVALELKSRQLDQTPQIYAPRGFHTEIYKNFIFGEMLQPPILGNVRYDGYKQKWRLDLGAIHGLRVSEEPDVFPIALELEKGEVNKQTERTIYARLTDVYLNDSVLEFPVETKVLQNQVFKARISSLMMAPLQVFVQGEESGVACFQKYLETHQQEPGHTSISFVKREDQANYNIRAQKGHYHITTAADSRPLIKQIMGYNSDSVELVISKLKHMSQWIWTKNLQSSNPGVFGDTPIELGIKIGDQEVSWLNPKNPIIPLMSPKPSEEADREFIKFKLKNRTKETLYVACLNLSSLYGVETDYLTPEISVIDAGEKTWALEGEGIKLKLPDYIQDYKWKEEITYFKLIIANSHFEVSSFFLNELGAPLPPMRSKSKIDDPRGFVRDKNKSEHFAWTTQLFEFRLGNPFWEEGSPE